MRIRSIIGAACAALAIATATPAAAHDVGEKVTPTFDQTIPNIPGKSLIAVVVDYAPGGASPSHTHAKSAFIFGYVLSGEIELQVNDGPKQGLSCRGKLLRNTRAPAIPSAAMRARPNLQSCSRCSSSIPTTRN